MTPLCYLIAALLPRLTGEEVEHVYASLDALMERRREAARRKGAAA